MPSAALKSWITSAARELDELVRAHVAVGGSARGRRYATLQVNHAYAVLLASQFQRFCRDLHSESVEVIVTSISNRAVRDITRRNLLHGRKLDVGNANAATLGADFGRLGFVFWAEVDAATGAHAKSRRLRLENLNSWRNAIAHQDWTNVGASSALHLKTVTAWRSTCTKYARTFDAVLATHLTAVVGLSPW